MLLNLFVKIPSKFQQVLSENNAYANHGDGIHVSGSATSNPNVLKKNRSGDKGKGNLGNGIWISGSGNGKPDPVEIEQNTTKANGRNGIQVTGTGWELKNNLSGGASGEDNGDCEFSVGTGNFNATGNKSNGAAIAGKDGTSDLISRVKVTWLLFPGICPPGQTLDTTLHVVIDNSS